MKGIRYGSSNYSDECGAGDGYGVGSSAGSSFEDCYGNGSATGAGNNDGGGNGYSYWLW